MAETPGSLSSATGASYSTMAESPGTLSSATGGSELGLEQQAAIQPYVTPEYYTSLRHFQVDW